MVAAACGCTMVSAMFLMTIPVICQVGHDEMTESLRVMNSINSIPLWLTLLLRHSRPTVWPMIILPEHGCGYQNNFFYNFSARQSGYRRCLTTYDTLKGTPSAQTISGSEVATTDRYSVNGKAADNAFFNCYNMTFYHAASDKKKDAKNSERNWSPWTWTLLHYGGMIVTFLFVAANLYSMIMAIRRLWP